VPEQDPNDPDIDAALEQMRGKAVAQRMHADAAGCPIADPGGDEHDGRELEEGYGPATAIASPEYRLPTEGEN
jgi:hypothetical protein